MRLKKLKTVTTLILLLFAVLAKAQEDQYVSGTVYTSLIPDNVNLVLTGNTKLVVNMDRIISRIEGDNYDLEIEGLDDHQLGLVNKSGSFPAIKARSLFSSAKLLIESESWCIYATDNITITNQLWAKVSGKNPYSAILCEKGDVMLSGKYFHIISTATAVYADKNVKLKGESHMFAGGKQLAVRSASGDVTIQSGFIQANGGILAESGSFEMTNGTLKTDGGSNNAGIDAKGNITLNGDISATGTYGLVSKSGDIKTTGTLNATGKSESAIRAEIGSITLEGNVSAKGKYSSASAEQTVTIKGEFLGKTTSHRDYPNRNAQACLYGDIVRIEEGSTVELNADLFGIFTYKETHLNGDVKIYAENKSGRAVYSEGNVYVEGGNILLKARRHGGNNPFDTVSYVGTEEAITWKKDLVVVSPMAITYPKFYGFWDYDYTDYHTIYDRDDQYYYISGARHIEFAAPQLSGEVNIQPSGPHPGNTMGCLLFGMVDSLKQAGVPLKVQWQLSNDAQTWENITSANGYEYVVKTEEVGKRIRAMVSSPLYGNKLYSSYRSVTKRPCNIDVVAPQLEASGSQVKVANAQAAQEYIILNSKKEISQLTENDWANSKQVTDDNTDLYLIGTTGIVNYVYTRVAETDAMKVGKSVLMESIYLGQGTALQAINMVVAKVTVDKSGRRHTYQLPQDDYGYYYMQSTDLIGIKVNPIPEDATFDGIYGRSWLIENSSSSTYGTFYADYECTQEIEADKPYKLVFFKAKSNLQMNWLDISAEITKGYNDLARDSKTFHVANKNGYILENVQLEDVIIGRGEILSDNPFEVYPVQATPKNLTSTLSSGEGTAPAITFNKSRLTFTVDATDATAGKYVYEIKENDTRMTYLNVTVTSPEIEGIAIIPEEIRGAEGDTIQLAVQFTPANAIGDIVWSSSNPDVAKVSEDGLLVITGGNPGDKAVITATCGEFSMSKEVTISGETYDLYIAGVQVTSANMDNLTEAIVEQSDKMMEHWFENSGTVTFDGFDLTLENMLLSPDGDVPGIWSGIDGLTINVVGENTVESQSNALLLKRNTSIGGDGTLNLDGHYYGINCSPADGSLTLSLSDATIQTKGYGWGISGEQTTSLTIENANVTAEGVRYGGIGNIFGGINLIGCSIIEPAGATIEDGFVNSGNEIAQKVIIAPYSPAWLKGDVNEDGKVDISDVVAVINQMAGTLSYPHADVNEDNKVDISDVVMVINIMAGQDLE